MPTFGIDSRTAFFTCEFNGSVTKVDLINRRVLGTIQLSQYFNRPEALAKVQTGLKTPKFVPDPAQIGGQICITPGMPQDLRFSPDAKTLYVADMMADGVHVVDPEGFKQIGFVPTGVGAHGLYPSRDGKLLYVANRGSNYVHGKPLGKGSVSVIDFATGKVIKTWPIPGGGSPDMGNVSADGQYLWLSGRFDDVVYRVRYRQRRGRLRQGGQAAARPDRMATARALQPGAHRQPALRPCARGRRPGRGASGACRRSPPR